MSNDTPDTRMGRPASPSSKKTKTLNAYYDESWALVIGIDKYQGEHAPLKNAVNDARGIADILTEQYNFKVENVFTLYDEQASRAAILEWLWDRPIRQIMGHPGVKPGRCRLPHHKDSQDPQPGGQG